MDFEYLLERMDCHAGAIRALLQGVGADQARWKPDIDSWSTWRSSTTS